MNMRNPSQSLRLVVVVFLAFVFLSPVTSPVAMAMPSPEQPSQAIGIVPINQRPENHIGQMFAGVHPRLFFTRDELPAIRDNALSTHQEIWLSIRAYADQLIASPLPSSPPSGADLNFYRGAGNDIIALAFACAIEDYDPYCAPAVSRLMTMIGWSSWSSDPDERGLELAHMLMGASLAYDWTYLHMTPQQQQQVFNRLIQEGERLFNAAVTIENVSGWSNWWQQSYMQNHYYIMHGALGIAAMALDGDVPATTCTVTNRRNSGVNLRHGPDTTTTIERQMVPGETAEVIGRDKGGDGFQWWLLDDEAWVRADVVAASGCNALVSNVGYWLGLLFDRFTLSRQLLNSISDGSWHESIPYQNYFMTFMLPVLTNYRDLVGYDLMPNSYLQAFADWRVYTMLADGRFILPYGDFDWDWMNGYAPQALLRFVASEYDNPFAQWAANRLVTRFNRIVGDNPWYVFEMLYYDPSVPMEGPHSHSLNYVAPDAESVVWRTGWDYESLTFGFKAGAYGGRYAFDSFIEGYYPPWQAPCSETGCQLNIEHDHQDAGTFYIFDNGHFLTTETVYWGGSDTSLHNTLLIDGQGQYAPPENRFGAYPEDFVGSDAPLLHVASRGPLNFLVTDLAGRYQNISGLLRLQRQVVFVQQGYFIMVDDMISTTPHQLSAIVHFVDEAVPDEGWLRGETGGLVLGVGTLAPQSPVIDTGNDGQPFGRISTASTTSTRLINVILPTDTAGWPNRPTLELLHDDTTAQVVRVTHNMDSDIAATGTVDDVFFAYNSPDMLTAGPYRSNANVALVRRDVVGTVLTVVVDQGTQLWDSVNQQMLIGNLSGQGMVSVTRNGTQVSANGVANGAFMYAPGATSLRVDGASHSSLTCGDYLIVGNSMPPSNMFNASTCTPQVQ
ncbi:MAG: SH3 domain-containing protein [Anaerolineaceae bacterium]|nr:SH3 domain-containing protein [Anaerolineaceae bacterium]